MSFTIIDPPVTPFSPRAEVEAWIVRLIALKAKSPEDVSINRALADANGWLALAGNSGSIPIYATKYRPAAKS